MEKEAGDGEGGGRSRRRRRRKRKRRRDARRRCEEAQETFEYRKT